MKTLDIICTTLMLIGGLNWGLIGFFNLDLVATLFGGQEAMLSRLVYSLVGLSTLYDILAIKALQRRWTGGIPVKKGTR